MKEQSQWSLDLPQFLLNSSAGFSKFMLLELYSLPKVFSYQVDAIHFYMLKKDAGHMLCVPLHTWVIWEIPGRKKHNLSTVSNQVQTPP